MTPHLNMFIRITRLVGVLLFLVCAELSAGSFHVMQVGSLQSQAVPPLTDDEQKRVHKAIDLGIKYLRANQHADGAWKDASVGRTNPVGCAALPALALLECGVPPVDNAIQRAARLVREQAPGCAETYDISLAILFLDRLGDKGDVPLLRSLALRLAAGQTARGGWNYKCPILAPHQEKALVERLRQLEAKIPKAPIDRETLPASAKKPPPAKGTGVTHSDAGEGDNSNTQFAILALWTARRYELPLGPAVLGIEYRFRSTQQQNGWGYRCYNRPFNAVRGSMTCVGILALALGRGWHAEEPMKAIGDEKRKDSGIDLGFKALGERLDKAVVVRSAASPKGDIDLYYLWSVERAAVLCDLKTIAGQDWYRWGLGYILPSQRADGSWSGGLHSGHSLAVSTSMGLLFLKRGDLMPDLRETLKQRVTITDPGAPKSPGEKSLSK